MRVSPIVAVMALGLISACATAPPEKPAPAPAAAAGDAPKIGAAPRREPCGGGPVSPFLHNSDQPDGETSSEEPAAPPDPQ